jgi:hypothetical protein
MQKKVFWITFIMLGFIADFLMPFFWALAATIPILIFSWWLAYKTEWFE